MEQEKRIKEANKILKTCEENQQAFLKEVKVLDERIEIQVRNYRY